MLPHHLYIRFVRLPLLLRILLITAILICLFGFFIHLLEPDNFPTVVDGIWWAVITASTVGYGDYVPLTLLGRITGVILLFVGAGFLSSYFATLSTVAVTKQDEYQKGELQYKGKDHLIIIGWNERSKEIVRSLAETDQPMLLIDETLKSKPLSIQQLHFIKGKALHDEVLIRANIDKASKIIITADQNSGELQADMTSILTLLAVKGLNSEVDCIVEILTEEQYKNAKRAGADEIIRSNKLTSFIILDSIHSIGTVKPLSDFLSQLKENKLTYQLASTETIGKGFKQANLLLRSDGVILIGLKKGEEIYINPQKDIKIEPNDQLLLLTEP